MLPTRELRGTGVVTSGLSLVTQASSEFLSAAAVVSRSLNGDVCWAGAGRFQRYAGCVRCAQGGGLTAEGRTTEDYYVTIIGSEMPGPVRQK